MTSELVTGTGQFDKYLDLASDTLGNGGTIMAKRLARGVMAMSEYIDGLVAEQVKDLADVERFRAMARTYMDEMDALKAEVERLERERGEYRNHSHNLIVDVDRLRTALSDIVAAPGPDAWHIARIALADQDMAENSDRRFASLDAIALAAARKGGDDD